MELKINTENYKLLG